MEAMNDEALVEGLAALASAPPSPVAARVYAGVVRVDGPEAVGPLDVAFTDRGVCLVRPAGDPGAFAEAVRARFGRPVRPARRPPRGLGRALRTGSPRGVDLDLGGLGGFARAVLAAAAGIPPGETRPYAWVAAEAGRPRAVRAAGSALARNPLPVLVPCHRVVRGDGALGEYLFGTDLKRRLLLGEGMDPDEAARRAAGARLVGVASTGVVCYPACRHARRAAPDRRVAFASLAAAVAAGFRPCRRCRPVGPP